MFDGVHRLAETFCEFFFDSWDLDSYLNCLIKKSECHPESTFNAKLIVINIHKARQLSQSFFRIGLAAAFSKMVQLLVSRSVPATAQFVMVHESKIRASVSN